MSADAATIIIASAAPTLSLITAIVALVNVILTTRVKRMVDGQQTALNALARSDAMDAAKAESHDIGRQQGEADAAARDRQP